MIKSTELMIGDYILVDGKPRRVESITKKKIGYHINPQTDKRLHYARLHDIEPIPLKEMRMNDPNEVVVSLGDSVLVLNMRGIVLHVDSIQFETKCTFKNIFGEALSLRRNEVHLLQHIIRDLEG